MFRFLLTLFCVCSVAMSVDTHAQPWNGPFGVEAGISKESLGRVVVLKPSGRPMLWLSSTAPNGHPSFESYSYVISPTLGLCKVSGVGVTVETNSSGTDLKYAYKILKEALVEKYGAPGDDFNFLDPGSIWNKPNDFMMGLLKKEMNLATFWNTQKSTIGPFPNKISTIGLDANALSPNKGWLNLGYEFTNFPACQAELNRARNGAL